MSQMVHISHSPINRQQISVFLVWLFHLSAMIGISLGYDQWFMSKTPINLSLIFLLLLWSFPAKSIRFWSGLSLFFIGGMFFEWIGVTYDFLFGSYTYGNNLGPKILQVPWFIGLNWAVLTLTSGVISNALFNHKMARIICGAGLMVFLDFFLEFSAPIFDFWTFESGVAPLKNYIAWFGISALFHVIYQRLKLKGDLRLSYHLYIAQLVFFVYFYGFYHL